MNSINNITVFCGSSVGNNETYRQQAEALGQALVKHDICLYYGGGNVGLMGVLADTMLKQQGKVIGCITEQLASVEVAHQHLQQLHIVETLNQRKEWLAEQADGFILLPGAAGSLDEFFEVYTSAQLGYHHKPLAILNVAGYYDTLIDFLVHAVNQAFMKPRFNDMLIIEQDPEALLQSMFTYQAPNIAKWQDVKR